MTEIKLSTDAHDIHDLVRYLDGDHHMSVYDRQRVVAAIKAQLPKPAIEEPQEFGSIVRATGRAGLGWGRPHLWQKSPMQGKHYWESQTGAVDLWSELTDVEVLRIGVGERQDVAPEETEDYKLGASDLVFAALKALRQLRAEAITSERKNAYDVAIQTVEGLQPEGGG